MTIPAENLDPGGSVKGSASARCQDAGREPCAATRYRILRPYARGGVGQVYVAEDTELHRQVALKEIRPQHARNPAARDRFLAEAEITGSLEHPGIVPVYGMGVRDDGRPFYAMRLIRGEDLRTAIHRFHASPSPNYSGREFRWMLGRFQDVCNAIAYAHSRGILHRDLKPGNIMLGPFGETLVVDWGLAKPIGRADTPAEGSASSGTHDTQTGNGSATMIGQIVGTPAYMSPEQAAGVLDAIGPASDVYSLGATLYVMLTDRLPFSGSDSEVVEHVKSGDFPSPRQVCPQVPSALDAICRKAMATGPLERYESPLMLAADVERWLADEPVSAWPEPWTEHVRRWVRQHNSLVAGLGATVGVAFLALAVAVPLLSIAWSNEATARAGEKQQRLIALLEASEAGAQRTEAEKSARESLAQRALAEASAREAGESKVRAERSLAFMVRTFRKPDPAIDGRSLKVVDLLKQAERDLDLEFADSPPTKGTLLNALGETFSGLGLTGDALAAFERALEIRTGALGEDHPETLESMNNLASAYLDLGRVDKAIPLYEQVLKLREARLGEDHPDSVESMSDLAEACAQAGQTPRAIALYERALVLVRGQRGEDHLDTITITDNLGVAYTAIAQPERSIPLHQRSLAKFSARLGEDHPTTLLTLNNLARAYHVAGRLDEAIPLFERALARLSDSLGKDHPSTLIIMNNLARALQDRGRLDRAIPMFQAVVERRRASLGHDHPDTLQSTLSLADALLASERPDLAIPLAREFLKNAKAIEGRLPAKLRESIPRAQQIIAGRLPDP